MPPLNLASLRPGDVLRQSVYTPHGAKVLPRGVTLTTDLISSLRLSHSRLLLGFPTNRRNPERAELLPDVDLGLQDGMDDQPAVISTAAWRRYLKRADAVVAERAARWVSIPRRTSDAIEPFLPEQAGEAEDHASHLAVSIAGARRRPEWTSSHAETLEWIAEGRRVDLARDALPMVDDMLRHLHAAPTRFPALALKHVRDADYLPSHALACAIMAGAIAARLGHDEPHIRLVVQAALFCDVGMAALSPQLLASDRPLDEVSLNRVRRHPALSVAMLAATTNLDERVLLIIHQHHEREDGTGYPRALRSSAIHDLAKVLAVADVFAAATAYRPYRILQHKPADGIAEAVRLANAGTLDRATALALLEAVGLYPAGSYVLLSDMSRAMVIAANPRDVARPVVQRLAHDGAPEGEMLDLASPVWNRLAVSAPVDEPSHQRRVLHAA